MLSDKEDLFSSGMKYPQNRANMYRLTPRKKLSKTEYLQLSANHHHIEVILIVKRGEIYKKFHLSP